jgi:hypothetical protein
MNNKIFRNLFTIKIIINNFPSNNKIILKAKIKVINSFLHSKIKIFNKINFIKINFKIIKTNKIY